MHHHDIEQIESIDYVKPKFSDQIKPINSDDIKFIKMGITYESLPREHALLVVCKNGTKKKVKILADGDPTLEEQCLEYLSEPDRKAYLADKKNPPTNANESSSRALEMIDHLENYIILREKEQKNYHSFIGQLRGFGSPVKRNAASKVILFLRGEEYEPFTDIELKAINDGRLGKITSTYAVCLGYHFCEDQKELRKLNELNKLELNEEPTSFKIK